MKIMTKMEDAYNNGDVEGFVEHSAHNVIIAMDEDGQVGIMVDNFPENIKTPDINLAYIGLIHQALNILSRDVHPIAIKAID